METKFHSLSEIPKQFWTNLKKQVKSSNGRVLFLVHPFFLEKKSGHDIEQYNKYKKNISDIIIKSKWPVIVLESHPGEIKRILGEKTARKTNLFCLPSMDSQGALVENIHNKNPIQAHDNRIVELLSKSGVKHISFGGSLTEINESYDVKTLEKMIYPPRLIPSIKTISSGCAGYIYANLIKSEKFNIVRLMPNSCFPNKPKFHKRGVSKKQTQKWIRKIKRTRLLNKMKKIIRLR